MITLSRSKAETVYGPSFIKHIMKDREEITLTEQQDKALRENFLMQIGCLVPFHYPIIYVVEAETGSCKVGQTMDIKRRVRSFDTGIPSRIYLRHIEVLSGAPITECELNAHRRLADNRVTGEWFDVSADEAIEAVEAAAEETGGSMPLMAAWSESEARERRYRMAMNGDPRGIRRMTDARESLRWGIDRIFNDMC